MASVTGQRAGVFSGLGAFAYNAVSAFGDWGIFSGRTLAWMFSRRPSPGTLAPSFYSVGVRSVPVIAITGTFIGMVLAVQSYSQFSQFGLASRMGAIINVSIVRELGPVLAATMLAGRVGSAIAAELATMRVTEQIDALRTLATHPVDYLVVPRLIALHAAMPLLAAESIAIGIGAGYIVGVYLLGIEPTYLWANMLKYTGTSDVGIGLFKALIFGGIVALIGCYKGMFCGEGAEGVGRATTEAVVYSSITILVCNFFLTLTLGKIMHTI